MRPKRLVIGIDPESVEIDPGEAAKLEGVEWVNIAGEARQHARLGRGATGHLGRTTSLAELLHEASALAMNVPLEVIVGGAPGWSEPWSRTRLAAVEQDANGWRTWLVDEQGFVIDEAEVQRARLPVTLHY